MSNENFRATKIKSDIVLSDKVYEMSMSIIKSFDELNFDQLIFFFRWAMAEGYGCHLIKHPDLLQDMVRQTRQRLGDDYPLEIKIRIQSDIR